MDFGQKHISNGGERWWWWIPWDHNPLKKNTNKKQEPLSYHCLHQVIFNITKLPRIDEHESRVERLVTFIFPQYPPTVYLYSNGKTGCIPTILKIYSCESLHTRVSHIPPTTRWSLCHLYWGIYEKSRSYPAFATLSLPMPVHQTGFNGRFNTSMGGYSCDRVWRGFVQIPADSTTLQEKIIYCSYPVFRIGKSSTKKLPW